jgi:hypothetical protein
VQLSELQAELARVKLEAQGRRQGPGYSALEQQAHHRGVAAIHSNPVAAIHSDPDPLDVADCRPIDMSFLPSYADMYLTNTSLREMLRQEQADLMFSVVHRVTDQLRRYEADPSDTDAYSALCDTIRQGSELWTRWCAHPDT